MSYGRALKVAGYSVTEAGGGRVALKILSTQPFDLVIVDLVMPEVDGVEVMEKAITLCPETKIIAMTGGGILSAGDYLKMAKYLGASFTLPKPCSFKDLLVLAAEATKNPTTEAGRENKREAYLRFSSKMPGEQCEQLHPPAKRASSGSKR